jgi:hypothetical protein
VFGLMSFSFILALEAKEITKYEQNRLKVMNPFRNWKRLKMDLLWKAHYNRIAPFCHNLHMNDYDVTDYYLVWHYGQFDYSIMLSCPLSDRWPMERTGVGTSCFTIRIFAILNLNKTLKQYLNNKICFITANELYWLWAKC